MERQTVAGLPRSSTCRVSLASWPYGETREEAYEGATALALRVAAERIELKELSPAEILPLSFDSA